MAITTVTSPAGGFAQELARHGDRLALVAPDHALTYRELDVHVDALAARLGHERRLVQLVTANRVHAIVGYLAALRGGHPVVLTPPDRTGIGSAYDPDVVIDGTDGELVVEERRAMSRHTLHPDLALLLSTSGTTGSPKLVRLSHRNIESNAGAIALALDIRPDDRAATTLPMHYCYGLSVINSHLACGAALLLTELSVTDRCFWDQLREQRGTTFAGVPHTFDLLDRIGFDRMELPDLRYITQAGGRMAPEKVQRFAELGRRRGWDLVVMYGQTEATARMAWLPPDLVAANPGAIGVPVRDGSFDIEADDDAGADWGELVYRGPNVMLGYADAPGDLALGRTVLELRTGDLARRTADGLVEIVGRRSRFVKLFGLRIGLDDVEERLATHGISALCAGDDQRLVIAVEPSEASDADVVAALAPLGLPHHAVRVVRCRELPRVPGGKPDYPSIIDLAETNVQVEPRDVTDVYADVLGREVGPDDSFVGLGGDSLSYVELSIQLEDALGHLPPDWHLTPIRELRPARCRGAPRVETNVVLRAVAIVLVVTTHARLARVPGGAHVLLAVAGYNFARFQLSLGPSLRSVARIATPAMCWIAVVAALTEEWSISHALLVHGVFGDPDARWSYWFIEALLHLLVPITTLLSVPSIRAFERRHPFLVATAVTALGVAIRFDALPLSNLDHRIYRPHEVLWLFGLGWALAVATSPRQRAVASAIALAAVPGFFGDAQRELLVLGGILLLAWVPTIPVIAPVNRVLGVLAGASLTIYLTHWQTLPVLHGLGGRPLAAAGSVVIAAAACLLGRRWRAQSRPSSRVSSGSLPSPATTPVDDGVAAIGRGVTGVVGSSFWGSVSCVPALLASVMRAAVPRRRRQSHHATRPRTSTIESTQPPRSTSEPISSPNA